MLKNNAFSGDKPPLIASGQAMMSGFAMTHENTVEVDKYINDFRLLDIRCSVLEEERSDYSNQLNNTKVKIKSVEKTLTQLTIEKEDCLTRLKKV
jgi:hypothetical protein